MEMKFGMLGSISHKYKLNHILYSKTKLKQRNKTNKQTKKTKLNQKMKIYIYFFCNRKKLKPTEKRNSNQSGKNLKSIRKNLKSIEKKAQSN